MIKFEEAQDGFIDEEGCFYDNIQDLICIKYLGTCGCGNPEEVARYIKNMFLKYVKIGDGFEDEAYKCWQNAKYEDMPTMFFLYWADNLGYIEHGITIRCSWMTEEGNDLLKALIKYFPEEVKDGPNN